MTDNEIIKAYGCCNLSHDECGGCDNCPCKIEGDCIVPSGFELEREVFNLLHRQKAEIERFEECASREMLYEKVKSEAIKEFAEKVKQKTLAMVFSPDVLSFEDYCECIDNLVKEMVGDTE